MLPTDMTVVAAFKIGTMPVIIGDLLVTSDIKGAAIPIEMPASGVPNIDYLLEHELSTLVQKVTQISDNLLVAWSGDFDDARKFISTLRADVGALPKVSWRRVKGALNRAGQTISDDNFGVVYLFFDGRISALGGMGRAKQYHVDGYDEEIFVAGSGSERLVELLSGYQEEMEISQHRAISILSRLWTLDLTSQVNLKERFGGAYELGAQIGNGVAKIGDILFANAIGTPEFEFGTDGRILKIDYVEDYLCLRVISHDYSRVEEFEQNVATLRPDGVRKRLYMIPPIDGPVFQREKYEEELGSVASDMNAEWTCVHLIAETKNGQHLSNQRAFHHPARNSPVEVNLQGEVRWTEELTNNLLTDLKSFYKENGGLPET